MPAVTREVSIAYAGVTFGGSSELLLHGPWAVEGSYETTMVRFSVFAQRDTEAAFDTDCDSIDAALRKPNQTLTITIGSTAFFSLSHSSNTGYLARPSFKIRDDATNTSRSRIYDVEIALRNPANLTGKNGLRIADIQVMKTPAGRRTLQVSGVYTALSSNSAVAQFEASVTTLVDGIITDLTGTWEATDLKYNRDDENKELTFTATREEIIANQSAGTIDNTALKQVRIAITRTRLAPGDATTRATRLVELGVLFDCFVDKAQSTDLRGLYEGTVLPHLLSLARTDAASSTIAIRRSSSVLDPHENRISATLDIVAVTTGSLLAHTIEEEIDETSNLQFVGVWNGNAYARERYLGFAAKRKIVIEETLRLAGGVGQTFNTGASVGGDAEGSTRVSVGGGHNTGASFSDPEAAAASSAQQTGQYYPVRRGSRVWRYVVGLEEARFTVERTVTVTQYEYAEVVTGAA